MPHKPVDRVRRIGIVGAPVLQTINSAFNAALVRFAAERGNWQFVYAAADLTASALRVLKELDCDGALVRITSVKASAEARRLKFPIVNFSSWLVEPGLPTVRSDDEALGRLCAEHLLAKGFRRFGCLRLPGGWYIQARTESFVAALKAAGVDADIRFLRVDSHPLSPSAEARFCKWVAELQTPAALFLPDDLGAPVLLDLCRKAGRRVPQDIAVVSAFGHPETAQRCLPGLSYADHDDSAIGRRSSELLDRLMGGDKTKATIEVVPSAGLVALGSTDTIAVDDPVVARAEDFLRRHAGEEINIADVVRQVSITRRSLERGFREALGTSMHDYLTRLRIERAKELLRRTPKLSLREVAQDSGFAGRLRLNAVFKQMVGVAPKQWRSESRNGMKIASEHTGAGKTGISSSS